MNKLNAPEPAPVTIAVLPCTGKDILIQDERKVRSGVYRYLRWPGLRWVLRTSLYRATAPTVPLMGHLRSHQEATNRQTVVLPVS